MTTYTYNLKQNENGTYELENRFEINWKIALLLIAILWVILDPLNLMASLMLISIVIAWELLKLFTPENWIKEVEKIFYLK